MTHVGKSKILKIQACNYNHLIFGKCQDRLIHRQTDRQMDRLEIKQYLGTQKTECPQTEERNQTCICHIT